MTNLAQYAATQDLAALRTILASVRLAFRIFFSFNAPGVTPVSWCRSREQRH
jgi:hypothetical protein